ncbi:MAG TPA: AAA family ATPase, partial [Thermomicrobiales bacterium]|nr:AAA family ATPase [Thermomicrobiales bacterium]
MASELLSTKLRVPPRSHHIVRRDRLVAALEDGIPRHKLTLVSAPAGYGKTTLLADWARSTSLPVAWLSLGEEDNDLERFFRYLLTAWEGALPGVSDSPLGILLGGMMPDREAVLTAFVNVADDLPDQIVFVLDDYHLIDDTPIHAALTFLLDHLPPTVHVVLTGRGKPPLPLARYRARQELLEIDAEVLQFQVEETEAFLNSQMRLGLANDTIASLHAQLEGWIAGTQMVALTLRRHDRPATDLVVSGRHRFIADYLSQDVLAHLPDELRRFLLRTSILDRLTGSLCDAVTADENGRAMLEAVERENLFLVPLDDNREWYRYHRLFADVLRDELQLRHPDEVAALHRRAAGWYLAHDLPEPAFEHSLAAHDLDLVVQILERYETSKLHGGELSVLQRWIDSIPAMWYTNYPLF